MYEKIKGEEMRQNLQFIAFSLSVTDNLKILVVGDRLTLFCKDLFFGLKKGD